MRARATGGRMGGGEHVYSVLTSHLWNCALVRAGLHGFPLPEDRCTCGAIRSRLAKRVTRGRNYVTDEGDQYYAELGAGEAATNFGTPVMSIATASTSTGKSDAEFQDLTIPSGGTQAIDGTYPMTNDTDPDNPGTVGINVITWRTSYATNQGNGTITNVAIHESGASGTDPLLNNALFGASFVKSSADTLKVYVNHQFLGQV